MVEKLIQSGANLLRESKDDNLSLLQIAITRGHIEIVKYLIQKEKIQTERNKLEQNIQESQEIEEIQKIQHDDLQIPNNADKHGNNSLLIAVKHKQFNVVKYLIETEKLDVKSQNNEGINPILMACIVGDIPIVKYLVSKGGDISSVDNEQNNAVHLAIQYQQSEVLHYILKNFSSLVDPFANNIKGMDSILQATQTGNLGILETTINAFQKYKLDTSIASSISECNQNEVTFKQELADVRGSNDIEQYLMAQNYANNLAESEIMNSNMMLQIQQNKLSLILEDRANVEGCNPVIIAAQYNQVDVLKYLIEGLEMNPNHTNYHGDTPLLIACQYGQKDSVRYLLKRRDISITDKNSQNNTTALMKACQKSDIIFIQWIIEQYKQDALDPYLLDKILSESDKDGNLCLHHAILSDNSTEVVELLLRDYFNKDIYIKVKQSALEIAINMGKSEIAEILLHEENIDKKRFNIEFEGIKMNLLEFCICKGLKKLVEIILPEDLKVYNIKVFSLAIGLNDSNFIKFLQDKKIFESYFEPLRIKYIENRDLFKEWHENLVQLAKVVSKSETIELIETILIDVIQHEINTIECLYQSIKKKQKSALQRSNTNNFELQRFDNRRNSNNNSNNSGSDNNIATIDFFKLKFFEGFLDIQKHNNIEVVEKIFKKYAHEVKQIQSNKKKKAREIITFYGLYNLLTSEKHIKELFLDLKSDKKHLKTLYEKLIQSGNKEFINYLIELYPAIDTNEALTFAAEKGNLELVKKFSSKSNQQQKQSKIKPLLAACYYSKINVAKYLIEKEKVDIFAIEKYQNKNFDAFQHAVNGGSVELVSYIIDKMFDQYQQQQQQLQQQQQQNNNNIEGQYSAINLDIIYGDTYGPIQIAARKRNYSMVKFLLKNEKIVFDINQGAQSLSSALYLACGPLQAKIINKDQSNEEESIVNEDDVHLVLAQFMLDYSHIVIDGKNERKVKKFERKGILRHAISSKNIKLISYMINQSKEIGITLKSEEGNPPLLNLFISEINPQNTYLLRLFVDQLKINIYDVDITNKQNSLFMAISQGNYILFEYLFKSPYGNPLEQKNTTGQDIYKYVMEKIEGINKLGSSYSNTSSSSPATILKNQNISHLPNLLKIAMLILEQSDENYRQSIDVEEFYKNKLILLQSACVVGNTAFVQKLIKYYKVMPSKKSLIGSFSYLQLAIYFSRNTDLVQFLMNENGLLDDQIQNLITLKYASEIDDDAEMLELCYKEMINMNKICYDNEINGNNLLLLAAERGTLASIKYLLKVSFDLEAKNNDGNNLILIAAKHNNASLLEYFLDLKLLNLEDKSSDSDSQTTTTTTMILENNRELNQYQKDMPSLDITRNSYKNSKSYNKFEDDKSLAKEIQSTKNLFNAVNNQRENLLLILASQSKEWLYKLARDVLDEEEYQNQIDIRGNNIILRAVEAYNEQFFNCIFQEEECMFKYCKKLDYKVIYDLKNREGNNVLLEAAKFGNLDCYKQLQLQYTTKEIEKCINYEGDTILLLGSKIPGFKFFSAKSFEKKNNEKKYEDRKYSLDYILARSNKQDSSNALMLATQSGNFDGVKDFIEYIEKSFKKDMTKILNSTNRWGNTALMLAAKYNNCKIIDLILKKANLESIIYKNLKNNHTAYTITTCNHCQTSIQKTIDNLKKQKK